MEEERAENNCTMAALVLKKKKRKSWVVSLLWVWGQLQISHFLLNRCFRWEDSVVSSQWVCTVPYCQWEALQWVLREAKDVTLAVQVRIRDGRCSDEWWREIVLSCLFEG